MNFVDAYVTKVLSEPEYIDRYKEWQWWEVKVEYDSYGRLSETTLTFKTKEEAEKVEIGYKFLA